MTNRTFRRGLAALTLAFCALTGGKAHAVDNFKTALRFSASSASWLSATGSSGGFGIRWDTALGVPMLHLSGGTEMPVGPATTSISAGSYSNANVTVDQYGRVTAITNGLAPSGGGYTTLQQNAVGLAQRSVANFSLRFNAVDNAGQARTDVDLATSGVTAGSYTLTNITVDQYGRVTSAASGTPSVPKFQAVYNSGAASADSVITVDSTRAGVKIQDTGTPQASDVLFGVQNNGGSIIYFDVRGTGQSTYPGIHAYQHINSWNGNVLFIGDDPAHTTDVTIGRAGGGTVTIANNFVVNGSSFSGGVDRANAGTFSVCGTNCTTLQLGGAASTAIQLQVSGTNKLQLNSSGNLVPVTDNNINFGDATHRPVAVFSFALKSGTTAATDTAGSALTITTEAGGGASSTGGGSGGGLTATAGAGGAAAAGLPAGNGGTTTVASALGGSGASGSNGTSGGATVAAGAAGAVNLVANTAGSSGNGGTGTSGTGSAGGNGVAGGQMTIGAGSGRGGGAGGNTSAGGNAGNGGNGGNAGQVGIASATSGGGVSISQGGAGGVGGTASGGGANGNGGNGGSGSAVQIGGSAIGGGAGGANGGAGATSGTGGPGGTITVVAGGGGNGGAAGAGTQGNGGNGGNIQFTTGQGGTGATPGSAGTFSFAIGGGNSWNINSGATLFPSATDTQFLGAASNRISRVFTRDVDTGGTTSAALDTAGQALTINSQQGGGASATVGGASGAITIQSNNGGAGDATPHNGGNSGSIAIVVGSGGASGGAGSTAGGGGNLTLQSGTPGAAGAGTGAASGDMIFNVPAGTGAAGQGIIRFQSAGTNIFKIDYSIASGSFITNVGGTGNLGSSGNYFGGVFSRHFQGAGTAPTIAVGAGTQLGTSPSAAVTAGSDAGLTITITTGTTPAAFVANTAVTAGTVTFNTAYSAAPRSIVCSPAGGTAAAVATGTSAVEFFAEQSSISTTQFLLRMESSATPTLAASTAYPVACIVMQ
jgi:hypothetical protein